MESESTMPVESRCSLLNDLELSLSLCVFQNIHLKFQASLYFICSSYPQYSPDQNLSLTTAVMPKSDHPQYPVGGIESTNKDLPRQDNQPPSKSPSIPNHPPSPTPPTLGEIQKSPMWSFERVNPDLLPSAHHARLAIHQVPRSQERRKLPAPEEISPEEISRLKSITWKQRARKVLHQVDQKSTSSSSSESDSPGPSRQRERRGEV